jgi:hypothetical protein
MDINRLDREIEMWRRPTARVALCLVFAAVATVLGGCVVAPYDGYGHHHERHWGDHGRDDRHWGDDDRDEHHWR